MGVRAAHSAEDLRDAAVEGHASIGGVPLLHQAAALGRVEQRQRRHRAARVDDQALDEASEARGEPRDARAIEQVRAELEGAVEAVLRVGHVHDEVEGHGAPLHVGLADREPRHLVRATPLATVVDHHLEDRRAARVARGLHCLHDLLERHALVREGAERGLPHAPEQLAAGGIAAQVGADREEVHEAPDQAFHLRHSASGHQRPDDHVVLARVATHERLERGGEHHEGRDAFADACRADAGAQLAAQLEPLARAGERLDGGGAGPSGPAPGAPGELRAPVREAHRRALRRPATAAATARSRRSARAERERLRRPLDQAPVARDELLDEDAVRPAVEDAVMDHHDQHVLALVHAESRCPEERSLREVEGPARLGHGELVRPGHPVAPGQAGEVPHRQLDLKRVQHCRDGKPLGHGERRAQRLVTFGTMLDSAPASAATFERPAEGEGHRAVVDRTLGGELMQEPQALLGEGERGGAGLGHESRDGAARVDGRGPVQVRGQRGHGARHEHLHQRQIDRERRPDARGELRRAQGVGAELEQVVVHPDVGTRSTSVASATRRASRGVRGRPAPQFDRRRRACLRACGAVPCQWTRREGRRGRGWAPAP